MRDRRNTSGDRFGTVTVILPATPKAGAGTRRHTAPAGLAECAEDPARSRAVRR